MRSKALLEIGKQTDVGISVLTDNTDTDMTLAIPNLKVQKWFTVVYFGFMVTSQSSYDILLESPTSIKC